MSCACENNRLARELQRIRTLAKVLAKSEGQIVVVYRNPDGTFGFVCEAYAEKKIIIEYITPY